jgi:hypothetical protein
MFKYTDFEKFIEEAGFKVVDLIDDIDLCQTIIRCKKDSN